MRKGWLLRVGLLFLGFLVVTAPVKAQETDEIMLTFAYPSLGQVYTQCVFKGDQPYLGLTELLSMFLIPFERNNSQFGFKGTYPFKTNPWEVDPVNLTLTVNGVLRPLKADQFHLGETDLYLVPELFNEIFGLEFTINPYGLLLSVVTKRDLPIDERAKRLAIRDKLKRLAPENLLKTYPMLYPRERRAVAPGMLDYNLGVTDGTYGRTYNYLVSSGLEFMGGDFQGTLSGFKSDSAERQTLSSARWRYVFKQGLNETGNPAISDIQVGQVGLGGPSGGRIVGLSLSNTPIIPRRVLDVFVIDGFTEKDAEVELLIAGQLVDFVRADEIGYYRFKTPLSYGTVRVSIRIYTPKGEVIMEDRQLQIPFTFVPKGFVDYNLQAGLPEIANEGIQKGIAGHANVAYGLTNNLTLRVGAYRSADTLQKQGINPYGSASLRIMDQYLLNVDVLPGIMNRFNFGVNYSNNTALFVQYSDYTSSLAAKTLAKTPLRDVSINYFFPFTLGKRTYGVRASAEQVWRRNQTNLRMQFDFNAKIGPIVTRLNYREELVDLVDRDLIRQRLATATLTYMVPRTPSIPVLMRGMFLRAQLRHDMQRFDAEALGSLQFSQTVWKTGRININYDRDILNRANIFSVGLLFDFRRFRSATQATVRANPVVVTNELTQNFSGSLGGDLKKRFLVATNRDQVGRAGVKIRMFLDENANSLYEKGEPLIQATNILLDQSATMFTGSDSSLLITQLQSYWKYRATLDVNALPDATLAPLKPKFTFVTDPNRYKHIDLPLYRTGTIEGVVLNSRNGAMAPQPGLRLHITRVGTDDEPKTIRTYSDGSFYTHGLVPGDYYVLVDSLQLAFMRRLQGPDTLRFTIKTMPEGDFLEGLEIRLRPKPVDTTKPFEMKNLSELEFSLGKILQTTIKSFVEAQGLFYSGRIPEALLNLNLSLSNFRTDYALALKGSIAFVLGRREEAMTLWYQAKQKNPMLIIPEMKYLEKIRQEVRAEIGADTAWLPNIPNLLDTGIVNRPDWLLELENKMVERQNAPETQNRTAPMALLEGELGNRVGQAVKGFMEAQEFFYRGMLEEAEASADASLRFFKTDHALALKGSIAFLNGRKEEAERWWLEAQQGNPEILIPLQDFLQKIKDQVIDLQPSKPQD